MVISSQSTTTKHKINFKQEKKGKTLTWRHHYHMFTYICSLLIEKDICDCQNISSFCVSFIRRSRHFSVKVFPFISSLLCYPFIGTFLSMWAVFCLNEYVVVFQAQSACGDDRDGVGGMVNTTPEHRCHHDEGLYSRVQHGSAHEPVSSPTCQGTVRSSR